MASSTPLGTPYIQIYYGSGELPYFVESLTYTCIETEPDMATLVISLEDSQTIDRPEFNTDARWILVWGYKGGNFTKRYVALQDVKCNFGKDGRKCTIEFADPSIYGKQLRSKELLNKANLMTVVINNANKLGMSVRTELNTELFPTERDFESGNLQVFEAPGEPGRSLDTVISPKYTSIRPRVVNPYYIWTLKDTTNFPILDPLTGSDFFAPLLSKGQDSAIMANIQKGTLQAMYKGSGRKIIKWGGLGDLRTYDDIPQAGKSANQLMNEYAQAEDLLVESRDNTLTVKARNFGQAPYRSYTYAEDGEFFEFTNSTKVKGKLDDEVNVAFSKWKAAAKEYAVGVENPDTETKRALLAKYLKKSGFVPNEYGMRVIKTTQDDWEIKIKTRTLLHDINPANFVEHKELYLTDEQALAHYIIQDDGKYRDLGDEGKKQKYGDFMIKVDHPLGLLKFTDTKPDTVAGGYSNNWHSYYTEYINPDVQVISQAEVFGETLLKTKSGVIALSKLFIHDEIDSPEREYEAQQKAKGVKEEMEIQSNPSVANVWGDPNIETGIVLSFLNLGKRYSGNYYVIKSVHSLKQGSGYTTSVDLARPGQNIKTTHNRYSTGRVKNTTPKSGDKPVYIKTTTITSRSNIR